MQIRYDAVFLALMLLASLLGGVAGAALALFVGGAL